MDIKKSVTAFVGTAMVAGMLATAPQIVQAQVPAPGVPTTTTAAKNPNNPQKWEKHPEIQMAIKDLERARMVLQKKAARDFSGNRTKAVREIDEAIKDLRAAEASDRH